jgi:hypothetical protein
MVGRRLWVTFFVVLVGLACSGSVRVSALCCCWHTSPAVTPQARPVEAQSTYALAPALVATHKTDVKQEEVAASPKASEMPVVVSPACVVDTSMVVAHLDEEAMHEKDSKSSTGSKEAVNTERSSAHDADDGSPQVATWQCMATTQCPGTAADYAWYTLVCLPNGDLGRVLCNGCEATIVDIDEHVTVMTLMDTARGHFYPAVALTTRGYLVAPVYCSAIEQYQKPNEAPSQIGPFGRIPYCQLRAWDITSDSKRQFIFNEPVPMCIKKRLDPRTDIFVSVEAPRDFEAESKSSELGYLCALTVCPNGRLISGSPDGTMKIWDLGEFSCERTFLPRYGERLCKHLIRANYVDDKMVEMRETMYVEELLCSLVALSDLYVAYGLYDGRIKIVNLKNGCRCALGKCHHGAVTALVKLPGGRFASGSADQTIKIWQSDDDDGFECIQTLKGHHGSITSLVARVTKRGYELISLATDGEIKYWRQ